jgi:acetyl-CoA carboxylase beta subunit
VNCLATPENRKEKRMSENEVKYECPSCGELIPHSTVYSDAAYCDKCDYTWNITPDGKLK